MFTCCLYFDSLHTKSSDKIYGIFIQFGTSIVEFTSFYQVKEMVLCVITEVVFPVRYAADSRKGLKEEMREKINQIKEMLDEVSALAEVCGGMKTNLRKNYK